jgi:hypothetical protein
LAFALTKSANQHEGKGLPPAAQHFHLASALIEYRLRSHAIVNDMRGLRGSSAKDRLFERPRDENRRVRRQKRSAKNALAGVGNKIVIALTSKYEPGRRSGAWIKIKRSLELYCVVIGFLPSGKDDFRSLILATEESTTLHCVGQVGTGFDNRLRQRINQWLWSHLRTKPVIPCSKKGKWVEPSLICRVS